MWNCLLTQQHVFIRNEDNMVSFNWCQYQIGYVFLIYLIELLVMQQNKTVQHISFLLNQLKLCPMT